MEKNTALFIITLALLYGIYNSVQGVKHAAPSISYTTQHPHNANDHSLLRTTETAVKLDTPGYTYDYIRHVIKHGSNSLGFPGGVMEGGYIGEEDAPGVACYVLHLSGKACPAGTESKDAHLFFSSNCAGCHGNDGRGLNGKYPDLTRPTLLGIERLRERLR